MQHHTSRQKIRRLPAIIPGNLHSASPTPVNRAPLRRWALFFVFLGCGFGVYWFFFFGPTFAIEKVEIIGGENESLTTMGNQLIGKNIFKLSTTSLEQSMRQAYPAVSSVSVVRGLPRVIRINITLREAKLRWQHEDATYVIDDSGEVYGMSQPSNETLPLIIDRTRVPLALGQQIVAPAFVEFVYEIENKIPTILQKKHVSNEITDTTFNLDVLLEGDIRIRLTTQRPSDEQLTAAAKIMTLRPEAKLIDVRVTGRGYWK